MRIFQTYAELNAACDLAPLTPGAFRFAKQYGPAAFVCGRCGQTKPLNTSGESCSTGYGISSRHMVDRGHVAAADMFVCFDCCAETDRADMIAEGKAVLCLTHDAFDMVTGSRGRHKRLGSYTGGKVTNWPGTLSIPCRVKVGAHNIARYRYDAWFQGPDGRPWHGVQFGDNTQLIRCRRLKG